MNDPRLSRVVRIMGDKIVLERGMIRAHVKGDIVIGTGTQLSPQLEIGMPDHVMENFIVGDQCRLFAGQIASRNFTCGDYVTVHEGVWAYGKHDIVIGHNGWFGRRCTLDAEGGVFIGNGFGAGQDTHMWSHIRHGDTLAGSRWLKYGEFRAGDDVWLVGRCTSAPAEHGDRSMAMVESNLTKSMPPDTTWGGNPAKDLTERLGPPFSLSSQADRLLDLTERIDAFLERYPTVDYGEVSTIVDRMDLEARTYAKTGAPTEVLLMRYLLPEAKFVPQGFEHVS